MPALLRATLAGLALGVSFNPFASAAGSALAAALVSRRSGARKGDYALWAAVLAVAWVAGDGVGLLGSTATAVTRDAAYPYLTAVVWALSGLLLGYALPAWVGAKVGRRVIRGTGWLSAGFIAVATSLALVSMAAQAGSKLAGMM